MRTLLLTLTTCLLVLPVQAKYSGGSGTAQDPYQIATAADLILLGETPADYDKHFVLTADIDLDSKLPGRKVFDKAVIAPGTLVPYEGFQGTAFSGVFDGSGHTILHLTIRGKDYVGLFGELGTSSLHAEVRNLGLVDVNVAGSAFVGGLVGGNFRGIVTQCYSNGAVSGSTEVGGLAGYNGNYSTVTQCHCTGVVSGGSWVGGVVGTNYLDGSVTHCYSTGTVDGSVEVGGLVGRSYATVAQCYSTGLVSGTGLVGGLVGQNFGGTVTRCYSTGKVSADGDDIGGLVGTNGLNRTIYGHVTQCYSTGAVSGKDNVGGLVGANACTVTQCYSTGAVKGIGSYVGGLVGNNNQGTVIACFWDIQTSGQTTSAGGTGRTTAEMQNASTFFCWAGDGTWTIDRGKDYPRLWWENRPGEPLTRAYSYGGGSGTEADPYLIDAPEQLNVIGFAACDWDKHFKLMADIDLSAKTWSAPLIPRFSGVFDGKGHIISHLTIKGSSYLGLFGSLESKAEVKDLGVVDVNITGGSSVGGLVGYNSGTVSQSYSTGAVSANEYVGGLVGANGGTMTQCYCTGAVNGSQSVGGLVGENYGAVTQSYSMGAVSGSKNVGGLAGYIHDGVIKDCYSTANTTGQSYVGGLVGYRLAGRIINCYAVGHVVGDQSVAGLLGMSVGGSYGDPVIGCFWDIETSGQKTATPWSGTGRTTAQMQTAKTFLDAGWDFVGETKNGTQDLWWIVEGKDYPCLWWEAAGK